MAAGASPSLGDDVLIVVDPGYERRYFYSANRAAQGFGYMGDGVIKVYRLDAEASDTLTIEAKRAMKRGKWISSTGKWTKDTLENFKTIIQNCTEIRRS